MGIHIPYCDHVRQLVPALILGAALGAAPVCAHTLTAPESVQAAGDGSYQTAATFQVGPGSVRLAAANVMGTENAGADEVMIDFFCTVEYPEGQQIDFNVVGQLINPHAGAMVGVQVFDCDGIEYWAQIQVLAPPVAVEKQTWGILKDRYR